MNRFRLLIFSRTIGFENDTRLRKITNTLSMAGVSVKGYLWERKNEYAKYKLSPNLTIITERLPYVSSKFPRGGAFVNFLEMMQETVSVLMKVVWFRHEIVVIQNHRLFMSVLPLRLMKIVGLTKRVVWDLRELPRGFMKGSFNRLFFRYLLQKSDSFIVVNESRLNHMVVLYGEGIRKNSYVVQNYVDAAYAEFPRAELSQEVINHLENRKYFYIQNPSGINRLLIETCIAVLKVSNYAFVVSGNIDELSKKVLAEKLGTNLFERILFTGMVPEHDLLEFIDNAYASIVLYRANSENNSFAEPNRLYQSLARGVPAIVGDNPTMKSVIESCEGGIVLDDDGSSIISIEKGVRELELNYDLYKANAMNSRHSFLWESNEGTLLRAILGPIHD